MQKTHDPRSIELLDGLGVVTSFTHRFRQDGLKGFCTIINRTRYVVINDRLCDEEQRVVAAHEAGHIVLHDTELKIGTFNDNDIYMARANRNAKPTSSRPIF